MKIGHGIKISYKNINNIYTDDIDKKYKFSIII